MAPSCGSKGEPHPLPPGGGGGRRMAPAWVVGVCPTLILGFVILSLGFNFSSPFIISVFTKVLSLSSESLCKIVCIASVNCTSSEVSSKSITEGILGNLGVD